jgi:hypothetical protein
MDPVLIALGAVVVFCVGFCVGAYVKPPGHRDERQI